MFIIILFFLVIFKASEIQSISRTKINNNQIFNINNFDKINNSNNTTTSDNFDKINHLLEINENYNNKFSSKEIKDEYFSFVSKRISKNLISEINDFKKDFDINTYKNRSTPLVNTRLSLFSSIAGTETYYWTENDKNNGGKFSMRLAPIPNSQNGSFDHTAILNKSHKPDDFSASQTSSISSLGSDQPSFGIYQITPINMIDIGVIKNNDNPRSFDLSKSMPGFVNNQIAWNKESINAAGITLDGNKITSVSLGAAQTILNSQALKHWDSKNNILVGQDFRLYADKMRNIATLRDDNYSAKGQASLDSKYIGTSLQNETALNVQNYLMNTSVENNWNRYLKYSPDVKYDILENNIFGKELTLQTLSSGGYGTKEGDSLTFKITPNGFISSSHIAGPMDSQAIARGLIGAFETKQPYQISVQSTTITFRYVSLENGEYKFIVDKSPINYSKEYPSVFHYMAYHSVSEPFDLSKMSNKWISPDGYIMNGNVKTNQLAFINIENTYNPTLINYNQSTNYQAANFSGSESQYFKALQTSSRSNILNVNQGSYDLTYNRLGTKINLSSFNLSNTTAVVNNLIVRYFVNGQLTDNSIHLVSSVNSNKSLIPSKQDYQLVAYLNSQNPLLDAKLQKTPNFVISVDNSSNDPFEIFGGSIGIEDFIFTSQSIPKPTNILDFSNVRNVISWIDQYSSVIKMGYGNNIFFASPNYQYDFIFSNPTQSTNSSIFGLSTNLNNLSRINFGNKVISINNISYFYNQSDQSGQASQVYEPYSYYWQYNVQDAQNNNHKIDIHASGDYLYSEKQLKDIGTLMTSNVRLSGNNSDETFNINQNNTVVYGNGGNDTFFINTRDQNAIINIGDFSSGDKIDLSSFGPKENIMIDIQRLKQEEAYLMNIKSSELANHQTSIYINTINQKSITIDDIK